MSISSKGYELTLQSDFRDERRKINNKNRNNKTITINNMVIIIISVSMSIYKLFSTMKAKAIFGLIKI